MSNEIVIVVKARNETRGVFDQLRKDAAVAGDDAGGEITERITEHIKVIKDDPTLRQSGVPIGDTIGRTISERIREHVTTTVEETVRRDVNGRLRDSGGRFVGGDNTVHEKVKIDVDYDEQTLGGRLHKFFDRFKAKLSFDGDGIKSVLGRIFSTAGQEAGDSAKQGLISSLTSGGDILSTLKSMAIGAAIVAAIPSAGPALSAALGLALGGGAIGVGIASAIKDPTVSAAIDGLKKKIGGVFTDFGSLFRGPTLDFLNRLPNVLKPLEPMFDQIKHDLAPIAQHLSDGVVGFLQNVLPSIGRAIDRSAPIIDTLADNLPGIGDQIARLLDTLSSHSDDAAQFFNLLLDGIKIVLKMLDFLITVSFGAYRTIRDLLTGLVLYGTKAAELLLDGFVGAFGWIPGIRSKLDAAKAKMDDFANHVVKELNKVPSSKSFTLYMRVVGENAAAALQGIGRLLSGRASGGITGSANGATPSGLTWVGEHGPELLAAPAGSRVYSNADSMRMAASGGGGTGGMIVVPLVVDGHTLATAIIDPTRRIVRQQFGGSVQAAYGVGA